MGIRKINRTSKKSNKIFRKTRSKRQRGGADIPSIAPVYPPSFAPGTPPGTPPNFAPGTPPGTPPNFAPASPDWDPDDEVAHFSNSSPYSPGTPGGFI